jgi:hypothetical protein
MRFRLAIIVLVLLGGAIVAEEPKLEDIDPTGKPKDYKAGLSTRYALWQDADGWHFRMTTTSEDKMAFTGSISAVGGRILKIATRTMVGKEATGPDGVKNGTFPAYNFSVKINQGVEHQVDFTLDDKTTSIKCDFKVNGRVLPSQIYIGAKGSHPKAATFNLAAKGE